MDGKLTLETAMSLKAAGFPQPDLAVGQLWYGEVEYKGGELEHTPLCVVVEAYGSRKLFLRRLTCEHYTGENGGKPQVFVPTATEILQYLGGIKCWQKEHLFFAELPNNLTPALFAGHSLENALANAYLWYSKQNTSP